MNLLSWVVMHGILVGCGSKSPGDSNGTGSDTLDPSDDTDEDDDTGPDTGDREPPEDLAGKLGSLHLAQWAPDATRAQPAYQFGAIFVDDDGGVVNLAECAVLGEVPCVASLPGVGETITEAVAQNFLIFAFWFDAGLLRVGDLRVKPTVGELGVYYEQPPDSYGGAADLSFDGDLKPYEGEDVFTWADPIAMTAPPPTERIDITGDESLDFAWSPGAVGDVYLWFGGGLTRLADDGEHTLSIDAAALQLRAPVDSVRATFSRVARTAIGASGTALTMTTASEQHYYLDYTDTDGWEELTEGAQLADRCNAAGGLPALGPGQYWADLSTFSDDHDVGQLSPTPGKDAVAVLNVQGGDALVVRYRLAPGDPVVYILPVGCGEDDVLAVADEPFGGTDEVVLSWIPSEDTVAYLVLDAAEDADAKLALDVQIL